MTHTPFGYIIEDGKAVMVTVDMGAPILEAEKVPVKLPIYNIAGDQDPVGNYGEGVYQVTNWLYQTGHTVKTKLYSGYRHEIHNYAAIKDEVEAGIVAFMDENL